MTLNRMLKTEFDARLYHSLTFLFYNCLMGDDIWINWLFENERFYTDQ